ncbi:NAD(P)-dependent oxidoreductase [Qaidamihabitans albus]|uniref:NAD(P)-dependent oxidoreductase n=1 Tax=Qaidamihabitans albus TaxID=2795733 RepID=UPI0018F1D6B4|nr:NAD(P)-dependent oxidoreductase [Qaidamihabitans albus]
MLDRLRGLPGADVILWGLDGPAPCPTIDLVVPPYMRDRSLLGWLETTKTRVVQGQEIGYDGVRDMLPEGLIYCNAAGVHESSTAELAIGLILSSVRGLARFAIKQHLHEWAPASHRTLAGQRVVVIGQGGVGRAIVDRLRVFDVEIDRVATRRRVDKHGVVTAMGEHVRQLGEADIVVLAVPFTSSTAGLVDDSFLSSMKDGALLVNVARGSVVDTDALVDHVSRGRIRAAVDVVDTEPLPVAHPFWSLPGMVITPHVGGMTDGMEDRVALLVREQVRLIRVNAVPRNVVIDGTVGQ